MSENTPYSIKLEAEDLYGEIATETVTVTVDNTPPLAPVQLSANADGANVTLHWTASTSPDVVGYIVLRDERIANAQGAVIGSWKPYLVTGTTHLDLNVADGLHRYVVMAMDKAENMSPPSNVASVTLDTRAPHAVMQQPLANAHIGRSTYLLATSPDTDVASVQFQFQAHAAPRSGPMSAPAPWPCHTRQPWMAPPSCRATTCCAQWRPTSTARPIRRRPPSPSPSAKRRTSSPT
ncbi:hypothetical protein LP420_39825 [Massilia sp. B-10]|nr:hypothetical protein LP420_39825 [Massilia sp. B-10]